MTPQRTLLLVDDDFGIRFAVSNFFKTKGFEVHEAGDGKQALELAEKTHHDAAILDFSLPDTTASELLPRLHQIDPNLPVVVFTAHGSIDLAVEVIKLGAENLLTKPADLTTLHVIVDRMLENSRNRKQRIVRENIKGRAKLDPFVGCSKVIAALKNRAEKLARADRPLIIHGETGIGKGVLARWLHDNGPRADEAFVDLNCASLSKELLESELFGHAKGAFTGAVNVKQGLLEAANKGTLFLDEIAEMDITVQPRILTVLEDLRFRRVGDVRDRQVDIGLIAATHQDMGTRVQEGRFRSDLYFRIAALPLRVPPLRERQEDIPVLASLILDRIGQELGRSGVHLTQDAMTRLQAYAWPGNIRELRNVLEHAVLLTDHNQLGPSDLMFDPSLEGAGRLLGDLSLQSMERLHIERVLEKVGGNVTDAARCLGIARSTLYEKMKRHGLD